MNSSTIYDAKASGDSPNWHIVDDDVMGGKSRSKFYINRDGNGVFQGSVSLENNGGFSSVRHRVKHGDVLEYSRLAIRARGDGKRYQLRIKSNKNDDYAYIAYFSTSGDWQEIEIPLNEMYPSFRGRKLDKPSFSGKHIGEIGFLIGNQNAEDFKLEVEKIELK
jgi:hypothetical protein